MKHWLYQFAKIAMQNHRAARRRQGARGTPYAVRFLQFDIIRKFSELQLTPGSFDLV